MAPRPNIFVFSWRDAKRRSAKLSKWMEVFVSKYGDAGLSRFRANEMRPESIEAELLALPFLVEKRLVILDDTLLEKGEKPNEEKKRLLEMLVKCIDSVMESTFVVFTATSPDESDALYQKLQEIAKIETIEPLKGNALYEALLDEFPTLSRTSARKFMERSEDESIDSGAYIEKLRLFSPESLKDENIIEEILPKVEEYSAFALSDSVLGFQTKRSLTLLDDMAKTRDIRMEIFIPLVEWIRTGLYIAKSRRDGKTDAAIAKEMGVHPYVLTKRPKWNTREYATMLEVFTSLVQTEIEGKTGEMPGADDDERLLLGMSRAIFCLEKTKNLIQSL